MDLVFGLLDSPLVLWALGLVGLLVVYRFVAARVRIPGGSFSSDELISRVVGPRWGERKLEREIERLKKQDNYLHAGQLLENAGRPAQAAEAYLEGQEYGAAAATFEKLGRTERAAELSPGRRLQEGCGPLHLRREAGEGGGALPREGQPPGGGAPLRACRAVGSGRRALREERVPPAGGGGVGEARRGSQGGGGLRAPLHGERLHRHHLLVDVGVDLRGGEERPPRRAALRQGGSPGPRRRDLRQGGTPPRRRRGLPQARRSGEGGRGLSARGRSRAGRRRLRAGGRNRARRQPAGRGRLQSRPPGGGGGVVRQGARFPPRGRALRGGGETGGGGVGLRGGR